MIRGRGRVRRVRGGSSGLRVGVGVCLGCGCKGCIVFGIKRGICLCVFYCGRKVGKISEYVI